MTRFSEKVFVIAMVVVMLGGLAGVLGYAAHLETNPPTAPPPHPSDEEMILDFQEHCQQYAELLQLSLAHEGFNRLYEELQEKTLSNDPSLPDPKDPAVERYVDLREQLGVRGVREEAERLYVCTSTCGWALSGSQKGYLYSRTPLTPLVRDTQQDAAGGYGEDYRHIEGDWYLFYSWDD